MSFSGSCHQMKSSKLRYWRRILGAGLRIGGFDWTTWACFSGVAVAVPACACAAIAFYMTFTNASFVAFSSHQSQHKTSRTLWVFVFAPTSIVLLHILAFTLHTRIRSGVGRVTRQHLGDQREVPSFQQRPFQPYDSEMLGKRQHPDDDSSRETSSSKRRIGMPIPSFYLVTGWVSSEVSTKLPPLPKLEPGLEKEVFTHPGWGAPNYERLEWLGDAYLEQIATCLISETFKSLPTGRCSQMREQLVRNSTLASYFREYGMKSRAILPVDFGGMDREHSKVSHKDMIKTQGDIFEAFVAGAILSDEENGLKNTAEWLKALWGRTILDQIAKAEKAETVVKPVLPRERLAQRILTKGVGLRYGDIPNRKQDPRISMPLYTVGVYLDGWGETGKLLGVGTALSKKEAGQKAATVALENKKLMKLYSEKKDAYMAARDAVENTNDTQQEE